MTSLRDKIEVVPLILALLPVLALFVAFGKSSPPQEAYADVRRVVTAGTTEPGLYRPAAEPEAVAEPAAGVEGSGAPVDEPSSQTAPSTPATAPPPTPSSDGAPSGGTGEGWVPPASEGSGENAPPPLGTGDTTGD